MIEKVIETIKKYNLIEDGDKIILAVSGGPDSISMLDILYKIKQNESINFEIIVAHVNHMIREESMEDAMYVKEFCDKRNIEFYLKSIDVKKIANNNKIGTEEAGRKERYGFFNELAKKTSANKIAIAHNKNDNVETVFMHILRGTGINGLKGIEHKRGMYIRPLIECERNEIENYCEENNLEPRIDKTNFENVYTRNKVRNIVIPYVQKEFNQNIIETIDRLSKLVTEEEEYMEKQVKSIYENLCKFESKKEIQLDLKKFNMQERVIKSRLILYTITRIFGSTEGIEKVHIDDIIKLCGNNIGNKFLTPNKNIKILVKNHKIYFMSQV